MSSTSYSSNNSFFNCISTLSNLPTTIPNEIQTPSQHFLLSPSVTHSLEPKFHHLPTAKRKDLSFTLRSLRTKSQQAQTSYQWFSSPQFLEKNDPNAQNSHGSTRSQAKEQYSRLQTKLSSIKHKLRSNGALLLQKMVRNGTLRKFLSSPLYLSNGFPGANIITNSQYYVDLLDHYEGVLSLLPWVTVHYINNSSLFHHELSRIAQVNFDFYTPSFNSKQALKSRGQGGNTMLGINTANLYFPHEDTLPLYLPDVVSADQHSPRDNHTVLLDQSMDEREISSHTLNLPSASTTFSNQNQIISQPQCFAYGGNGFLHIREDLLLAPTPQYSFQQKNIFLSNQPQEHSSHDIQHHQSSQNAQTDNFGQSGQNAQTDNFGQSGQNAQNIQHNPLTPFSLHSIPSSFQSPDFYIDQTQPDVTFGHDCPICFGVCSCGYYDSFEQYRSDCASYTYSNPYDLFETSEQIKSLQKANQNGPNDLNGHNPIHPINTIPILDANHLNIPQYLNIPSSQVTMCDDDDGGSSINDTNIVPLHPLSPSNFLSTTRFNNTIIPSANLNESAGEDIFQTPPIAPVKVFNQLSHSSLSSLSTLDAMKLPPVDSSYTNPFPTTFSSENTTNTNPSNTSFDVKSPSISTTAQNELQETNLYNNLSFPLTDLSTHTSSFNFVAPLPHFFDDNKLQNNSTRNDNVKTPVILAKTIQPSFQPKKSTLFDSTTFSQIQTKSTLHQVNNNNNSNDLNVSNNLIGPNGHPNTPKQSRILNILSKYPSSTLYDPFSISNIKTKAFTTSDDLTNHLLQLNPSLSSYPPPPVISTPVTNPLSVNSLVLPFVSNYHVIVLQTTSSAMFYDLATHLALSLIPIPDYSLATNSTGAISLVPHVANDNNTINTSNATTNTKSLPPSHTSTLSLLPSKHTVRTLDHVSLQTQQLFLNHLSIPSFPTTTSHHHFSHSRPSHPNTNTSPSFPQFYRPISFVSRILHYLRSIHKKSIKLLIPPTSALQIFPHQYPIPSLLTLPSLPADLTPYTTMDLKMTYKPDPCLLAPQLLRFFNFLKQVTTFYDRSLSSEQCSVYGNTSSSQTASPSPSTSHSTQSTTNSVLQTSQFTAYPSNYLFSPNELIYNPLSGILGPGAVPSTFPLPSSSSSSSESTDSTQDTWQQVFNVSLLPSTPSAQFTHHHFEYLINNPLLLSQIVPNSFHIYSIPSSATHLSKKPLLSSFTRTQAIIQNFKHEQLHSLDETNEHFQNNQKELSITDGEYMDHNVDLYGATKASLSTNKTTYGTFEIQPVSQGQFQTSIAITSDLSTSEYLLKLQRLRAIIRKRMKKRICRIDSSIGQPFVHNLSKLHQSEHIYNHIDAAFNTLLQTHPTLKSFNINSIEQLCQLYLQYSGNGAQNFQAIQNVQNAYTAQNNAHGIQNLQNWSQNYPYTNSNDISSLEPHFQSSRSSSHFTTTPTTVTTTMQTTGIPNPPPFITPVKYKKQPSMGQTNSVLTPFSPQHHRQQSNTLLRHHNNQAHQTHTLHRPNQTISSLSPTNSNSTKSHISPKILETMLNVIKSYPKIYQDLQAQTSSLPTYIIYDDRDTQRYVHSLYSRSKFISSNTDAVSTQISSPQSFRSFNHNLALLSTHNVTRYSFSSALQNFGMISVPVSATLPSTSPSPSIITTRTFQTLPPLLPSQSLSVFYSNLLQLSHPVLNTQVLQAATSIMHQPVHATQFIPFLSRLTPFIGPTDSFVPHEQTSKNLLKTFQVDKSEQMNKDEKSNKKIFPTKDKQKDKQHTKDHQDQKCKKNYTIDNLLPFRSIHPSLQQEYYPSFITKITLTKPQHIDELMTFSNLTQSHVLSYSLLHTQLESQLPLFSKRLLYNLDYSQNHKFSTTNLNNPASSTTISSPISLNTLQSTITVYKPHDDPLQTPLNQLLQLQQHPPSSPSQTMCLQSIAPLLPPILSPYHTPYLTTHPSTLLSLDVVSPIDFSLDSGANIVFDTSAIPPPPNYLPMSSSYSRSSRSSRSSRHTPHLTPNLTPKLSSRSLATMPISPYQALPMQLMQDDLPKDEVHLSRNDSSISSSDTASMLLSTDTTHSGPINKTDLISIPPSTHTSSQQHNQPQDQPTLSNQQPSSLLFDSTPQTASQNFLVDTTVPLSDSQNVSNENYDQDRNPSFAQSPTFSPKIQLDDNHSNPNSILESSQFPLSNTSPDRILFLNSSSTTRDNYFQQKRRSLFNSVDHSAELVFYLTPMLKYQLNLADHLYNPSESMYEFFKHCGLFPHISTLHNEFDAMYQNLNQNTFTLDDIDSFDIPASSNNTTQDGEAAVSVFSQINDTFDAISSKNKMGENENNTTSFDDDEFHSVSVGDLDNHYTNKIIDNSYTYHNHNSTYTSSNNKYKYQYQNNNTPSQIALNPIDTFNTMSSMYSILSMHLNSGLSVASIPCQTSTISYINIDWIHTPPITNHVSIPTNNNPDGSIELFGQGYQPPITSPQDLFQQNALSSLLSLLPASTPVSTPSSLSPHHNATFIHTNLHNTPTSTSSTQTPIKSTTMLHHPFHSSSFSSKSTHHSTSPNSNSIKLIHPMNSLFQSIYSLFTSATNHSQTPSLGVVHTNPSSRPTSIDILARLLSQAKTNTNTLLLSSYHQFLDQLSPQNNTSQKALTINNKHQNSPSSRQPLASMSDNDFHIPAEQFFTPNNKGSNNSTWDNGRGVDSNIAMNTTGISPFSISSTHEFGTTSINKISLEQFVNANAFNTYIGNIPMTSANVFPISTLYYRFYIEPLTTQAVGKSTINQNVSFSRYFHGIHQLDQIDPTTIPGQIINFQEKGVSSPLGIPIPFIGRRMFPIIPQIQMAKYHQALLHSFLHAKQAQVLKASYGQTLDHANDKRRFVDRRVRTTNMLAHLNKLNETSTSSSSRKGLEKSRDRDSGNIVASTQHQQQGLLPMNKMMPSIDNDTNVQPSSSANTATMNDGDDAPFDGSLDFEVNAHLNNSSNPFPTATATDAIDAQHGKPLSRRQDTSYTRQTRQTGDFQQDVSQTPSISLALEIPSVQASFPTNTNSTSQQLSASINQPNSSSQVRLSPSHSSSQHQTKLPSSRLSTPQQQQLPSSTTQNPTRSIATPTSTSGTTKPTTSSRSTPRHTSSSPSSSASTVSGSHHMHMHGHSSSDAFCKKIPELLEKYLDDNPHVISAHPATSSHDNATSDNGASKTTPSSQIPTRTKRLLDNTPYILPQEFLHTIPSPQTNPREFLHLYNHLRKQKKDIQIILNTYEKAWWQSVKRKIIFVEDVAPVGEQWHYYKQLKVQLAHVTMIKEKHEQQTGQLLTTPSSSASSSSSTPHPASTQSSAHAVNGNTQTASTSSARQPPSTSSRQSTPFRLSSQHTSHSSSTLPSQPQNNPHQQ